MYNVREWNRFLIPYEQAVEELKIKFKALRNGYREVGEYSPIEFVTGRVKKVSSILEKSKKLGIPYDEIQEKMEDIAGIRIMCQLLDDIYDVVDFIKARDGKDFTILYTKDYIKNPKESGYRSYHLVIKYPVHTAFGYTEVLAEIQIRTLAMNFWAIIEHSLNYKYQQKIPEKVKQRLEKSADAVWNLDAEMLAIKDEIISAQVLFEVNSDAVQSITTQIQLMNAWGQTDLAAQYQKKLDSILDLTSNDVLEELLSEINAHLEEMS
ncbi:MAG: GTP pyrophosphokinase family protein [Tissierellia bacterium]|nr:GTP pyrophosphokinase family protein [Tissierellia bacterium]